MKAIETLSGKLGLLGLFAVLLATLCLPGSLAFAVTSEEKQAEADQIMAQIDELQTQLNAANDERDAAQSEYESAKAKMDEAQAAIDEQDQRINSLKGSLSSYVVQMYKADDPTMDYIGAIADSASFDEFISTMQSLEALSGEGASLLSQAKDAKAQSEQARAAYEAQSKAYSENVAIAEQKAAEIAGMQEQLRNEAMKITAEVAELQAQEQAEAEAARMAAAAAEAAQKTAAGLGYSLSGDPVISGNGVFANPCPDASISSTFGYRDFDSSFHKGLDLAAAEGTPYYAAEAGTVIYATNDGGYNGGAGNWVVISHGNGIVTKYMHSSATLVNVGDSVQKGQLIGLVGNTGNSFGAHLHFQVEYNNNAVDPLGFL